MRPPCNCLQCRLSILVLLHHQTSVLVQYESSRIIIINDCCCALQYRTVLYEYCGGLMHNVKTLANVK